MWGPDHSASLDSKDLKNLVIGVRKIESSIGSKNWNVQREEISQRKVMSKGTYASKDILKGEKITLDKVSFLRPRNKVTPMDFYLKFNNKKAKKDFKKESSIK